MTWEIDDLMALIASEAFKCVLEADQLQFTQYMAVITILIKKRIPFDTKFTPGTRRLDPEFTLTIYITPTSTITLSFSELSLTDTK